MNWYQRHPLRVSNSNENFTWASFFIYLFLSWKCLLNNLAGSKENVQDKNDVPEKPSRKAHYIVLVYNNYHHYNELLKKFGQTTTDEKKNMKNDLKETKWMR